MTLKQLRSPPSGAPGVRLAVSLFATRRAKASLSGDLVANTALQLRCEPNPLHESELLFSLGSASNAVRTFASAALGTRPRIRSTERSRIITPSPTAKSCRPSCRVRYHEARGCRAKSTPTAACEKDNASHRHQVSTTNSVTQPT